jgi:hypothetical protein
MKTILILLASLTLAVYAPAQEAGLSTKGTASGTTLSYAVVPPASGLPAAPLVTFVNLSSSPASTLTAYDVVFSRAIRATNSTETTIALVQGGFAAMTEPVKIDDGDIILIYRQHSRTWQRRVVSSFNEGNGLLAFTGALDSVPTLENGTSTSVDRGDIVYRMRPVSVLPIASATTLNGPGITAGRRNLPLLLDLAGTNSPTINLLTVHYRP